MSVFLEASALSFSARGRRLVDNVSLRLECGSLTAMIGPNGAGKSTLFRLLTGERAPCHGEILVSGEPLAAMAPWRLAEKRAVMAQNATLAFPFRAHEVARLGLAVVGRRLPAARIETILAASLSAAGVTHLADRDYQTLSGGEQQRVRFARTLCQLKAGQAVGEGQALFLDEPTASLDLEHQFSLMSAARALAEEGVAVVAIVHDLNIAAAFAREVIVLSDGKIVAHGRPGAVLTETLVGDVFHVRLRVVSDAETGRPIILPQGY
ncbi:heme ABC transporter ATP-binding protein [Rhodoblastus sp.]|uniref:heme ABC transporter ATP-binding protein n=1 Tax=Rhodoblastus sp. TaxID=1962975 RepID=UPI0035AEA148